MGATPKDQDAKVRLGYKHPKSIVWDDGREKLVKQDWSKRVQQLAIRAGFRCEMVSIMGLPHVAGCSGEAEEPHHIIMRSELRDDRLSNLAGLSHYCHASLDPRKVRWTPK